MIHGLIRVLRPAFLASMVLGLAFAQPLWAQGNRVVPAPVRGHQPAAASSSARIGDGPWLIAEENATADPDGWADPAPLTDPRTGAEADPFVDEPSERLDWLDQMSQLQERLDDLEAYRTGQEKAAEKAAKTEKDKK